MERKEEFIEEVQQNNFPGTTTYQPRIKDHLLPKKIMKRQTPEIILISGI